VKKFLVFAFLCAFVVSAVGCGGTATTKPAATPGSGTPSTKTP
jgi:hypothetical protein